MAVQDRRQTLRRRLQELESELGTLHGELARLGPGEPLPGLFLLLEVGAHLAALPAAMVLEIVRLVETTSLPESLPQVLGTFLFRADPFVAIDLARCLGEPNHVPEVDAHMVVLAGPRRAALVVDRVRALVEAPLLADLPEDGAGGWLTSPLVVALCHAEGQLVPVLRIEPLLEGLAP